MATDDELARTATATGPPAPLRHEGEKLGKYRLEGVLGAGGMGVVHRAFDPDLERRVAIKLLRDAPGDVSRARLLREARAMARLSHPNVVSVFEVGTIEGRDFVAMELIDGSSIAEWVRGAPRSSDQIVDAFLAAGHGLAAAHAEGLVHRDFKPHNVLRSKRGRVVVTDFGLARGVDAQLAITRQLFGAGPIGDGTPSSPLLTATGAVVGTPAYMAPEQWKGDSIGPATDQFAFCVALWEALSGARPFSGETGEELQAAVERGPTSLDASKIPRRFRALLKRGLDPHPARRWASMEALLGAITRARRSGRVWVAAGGVAVLAAVIVVVAMLARGSDPAPPPAVPRVPPAPAPALAPAAPSLLPLGDHDQLVASIQRIDDRQYAMPRATRDQLLFNGAALFAQDARIVPLMNMNRPEGYKVYAIQPGSIYAALGLANGDSLVSLNNIAILPGNLAHIIEELRTDQEATLDFVRKNERLRYVIEFR